MSNNLEREIEREVVFGIVPVLPAERKYGFLDAFLVLSGYCIATWSYTQGSYLAGLVGFKQLLVGAFFAAILMLILYQLPNLLATRYGIDTWIWLKSVFGPRGIQIMTVTIIVINFPWYAVCAELFASSMTNLAGVFGLQLPSGAHAPLAVGSVVVGTFIAYRGIGAITWTTRVLVPLLMLLGLVVIYVGFTSVPAGVIWNYRPDTSSYADPLTPYLLSIEANFAFVITLVGAMSGIPRLTRNENSGFWSGVLGQGLSGSLFVVVGAVMAIATKHVTGKMVDDPTAMLATLAFPAMALGSLLLVAFANIGTQAVGSYLYGVMLKSSFRKADYRILILILAAYVAGLCAWGQIVKYFGTFLTLSACVYAPLAALLVVDFFFVRKQKLALRSAFGIPGHRAYDYTGGINWVGFFCVAAGIAMSLSIYNPLTGEVRNRILFHLTPTGFSFLGTGLLYQGLSRIPAVGRYLLRDRGEITV